MTPTQAKAVSNGDAPRVFDPHANGRLARVFELMRQRGVDAPTARDANEVPQPSPQPYAFIPTFVTLTDAAEHLACSPRDLYFVLRNHGLPYAVMAGEQADADVAHEFGGGEAAERVVITPQTLRTLIALKLKRNFGMRI